MTGGVRRVFLDDAWIQEHWTGAEVATLCREYNATHGTEYDRRWFNYYCKRWLELQTRGRRYTQEEKDWLIANYSLLGSKKTALEFQKKFCRNVSPETIKKYCSRWLGCLLTDEERRRIQYDSFTKPIGTLTVNCRGSALIKTEDGWIKATHSQVDVPKGAIAFNLDGNIYNNSPENIGITTNSVFRKLRNYGFWSKEREVTRAGLLCCELESLLESK